MPDLNRDEAERLLDRYETAVSRALVSPMTTVEAERVRAAEVEESRAAVLAAMTRTQWQDISTAPRDKTKVLLWKNGWEYAPVAHWGRIDGDDGPFGAWLFENEDLCLGVDSGCLGWNEDIEEGAMPTHWQPLPAAPEAP